MFWLNKILSYLEDGQRTDATDEVRGHSLRRGKNNI